MHELEYSHAKRILELNRKRMRFGVALNRIDRTMDYNRNQDNFGFPKYCLTHRDTLKTSHEYV